MRSGCIWWPSLCSDHVARLYLALARANNSDEEKCLELSAISEERTRKSCAIFIHSCASLSEQPCEYLRQFVCCNHAIYSCKAMKRSIEFSSEEGAQDGEKQRESKSVWFASKRTTLTRGAYRRIVVMTGTYAMNAHAATVKGV